MAVQGAAPSMMAPAMYSPASSGVIQAWYNFEKNSQAKNAIVKGLISQLITRVRITPLGLRPTLLMLVKSTCSIIG